MPAINWTFLCDYAFVDMAGKASIIRTFENLNFRSLPGIWPQMYIALEIVIGEGETFSFTALMTSPSGNKVAEIKAKDVRAERAGKGIFTFGFFNTKFTETGEHHIELFIDENSIHIIPFAVQLTK